MVYVHPLLDAKLIRFVESNSKSDVLEELIGLISQSPNVTDAQSLRRAIFDRENLMSTGMGLGLAIPHVKIPSVKDLTIAVGICKKGIEWDALDGKPVHIIFLFAGSEDQHNEYLRTLSKIVLVLKNAERRRKLTEANDVNAVIDLFKEV